MGAELLLGVVLLGAAAPRVQGAWQATTPLPSHYIYVNSVVDGGFIYQRGGMSDTGVCGGPDVNFARINPDGSVGPWAATTPLPGQGTQTLVVTCGGAEHLVNDTVPIWGSEMLHWNGTLYVLGGALWSFNQTGADDWQYMTITSAVYYAKAGADGSLGPWQRAADLPALSFLASGDVHDGVIYLTGGRDFLTGGTRRDVYTSRINPDGSPGPWQLSASPLPEGRVLHAATASSDRLYVSGGMNNASWITNSVFSAPINADGTLGAWGSEPSLPVGQTSHGMKARHGVLYSIAGYQTDWPSAAVYSAAISTDGSLQPWTAADPLPINVMYQGAASTEDSLYSLGGTDLENPQNGVYQLPDTTPPAAVADLGGLAEDSSSLMLQWTATGNDDAAGSVHNGRTILRYSVNPADFSSFDSIPNPLTVPASYDPGQAQSQLLSGLSPATTYYFALKAVDSAGNASAMSNVSSAVTYNLAVSPETPSHMRFESAAPGFSIGLVSTQAAAVALQTAHGTLLSSIYDISPSGVALNPAGILTFSYDGSPDASTLAIYKYIDSTVGWSSAACVAQVVDQVNHAVSGENASTSIYALFSSLNAVPALSSMSPASATAGAAGLTLTLDGSGFSADSVLRWNGTDLPTTFVNTGRLTAAVPSADLASAGAAGVTVFNPAPGGGTSGAASFTTYNPAPALASLSPNSATAGGAGLTLTVNGSGFVASSLILWNGAAKTTTLLSSSQLRAAVSAADIAAAGSVSVGVFSPAPGGGTSGLSTFTINNPAPALVSLSPSTATAGGPEFTLTVDGANFLPSSIVRWNGADRPTSFVGPSRLTAAIPASDIASAAAEAVTVFNPAPGGGTSEPATFTISKPAPPPNPVPVLASLSPASALAGGPDFTLTISGSGFAAVSVARWNGEDRPTDFVSSSKLAVLVSAADIASAGSAKISVFSPAPGGGTSGLSTFTINNPAPALASLSPNSATAGGAGLTLTVNGSGFTPSSVVRWNGAAKTTTFISPSQLTAAIAAADITSAGLSNVTVVNPAPGGGTSAAVSFTVNNPAPTLVSLSPASALAGGAAFTLTVNGSGFVPASVVRWNGAGKTTSFISASQLSAQVTTADISVAGSAAVSVFNPAPGGGSSTATAFAIERSVPAPTLFLVTFNPRTLQLESHGEAVKATIRGYSGAKTSEIDRDSLALTFVNGQRIHPPLKPVSVDHHGEGRDEDDKNKGEKDKKDGRGYDERGDRLRLTFDRDALASLLTPGTNSLILSGSLRGGAAFSAQATLNALEPRKHQPPSHDSAPVCHSRTWPAPPKVLALATSGYALTAGGAVHKIRGHAVVQDRVVLRVPEGAAPEKITLSISTTAAAVEPDKEVRRLVTEHSGLSEASLPTVFGPEGTVFSQPVTLDIPYDPALLPPGFDESHLAVHYWNPRSSQWERLDSTVDRQAKIVRAQTTHFSLYQVLAPETEAAPAASAVDDFSLRAVYAFPNPSRNGAPVVFRIQPGLADAVMLRVYDLSGRKVHESGNFQDRGASFDDGNGLGAQYTYEHSWNVSGAASGVYTYAITALKSGKSPIRKTGKVGVIK